MSDHPILLRLANAPGSLSGPLILERADQNFLEATLAELAGVDGLDRVAQGRAASREQGVLKLYQPVHRTFYIALFEAVCEAWEPFPLPRLDPSKIDSAGLVVRRRAEDDSGRIRPNVWEGWQSAGQRLRGWLEFHSEDLDRDPDVERRPFRTLGDSERDREWLKTQFGSEAIDPLSESTTPLFVAPPEICEATGKTLLYALIPVTSSETAEAPGAPSPFADGGTEDQFLRSHFSFLLRGGGAKALPSPGIKVAPSAAGDATYGDFVTAVRQVAVELDAFGGSSASNELFAALNAISVPLTSNGSSSRPAGEFLKDAANTLLNGGLGREGAASFTMPYNWPALSAAQSARLFNAARASMQNQWAALGGKEGRFEQQGRQYAIRGFVRVKRDDGCPPELFWSEPSEPFTIAAWFETGKGSPTKVALPDPFDREQLRKSKPNVAFILPKRLFDFIQANSDAKKTLKDGPGGGGSGIGLGWICGFNIPTITICAFICLNIFLSLFDLIFQWMMFIKICIPYPKPKPGGSGG